MINQKLHTTIKEALKLSEELYNKLDEINNLISVLLGPQAGNGLQNPPKPLVGKLAVIHKIYQLNEDGIANMEDISEYWNNVLGRDTRGIGGLFQGYARLTKLANNKIAITPQAEELYKKYKNWITQNFHKIDKTFLDNYNY